MEAEFPRVRDPQGPHRTAQTQHVLAILVRVLQQTSLMNSYFIFQLILAWRLAHAHGWPGTYSDVCDSGAVVVGPRAISYQLVGGSADIGAQWTLRPAMSSRVSGLSFSPCTIREGAVVWMTSILQIQSEPRIHIACAHAL